MLATNPLRVRTIPVGPLSTNCYLAWRTNREDCVVIDPGADAEAILSACEGRTIAAILLTHGHFDHIGAVADLMREDVDLVIHRLDSVMLRDPQLNVSGIFGQPMTAPRATLLVEEGDTLDYAGITFRVLHTPGHTPGSVCYEADNALFTGDTLFTEGYGRTDLPGGCGEDMRQSLRRVTPMRNDHTIYPGHGG